MALFDPKNSKRGLSKIGKAKSSYGKLEHKLYPLQDSKSLHHEVAPAKARNNFKILFDNFKALFKTSDSRTASSMALIYHVWEEDELDSLLDLFASLKSSNNPKDKINIKYDDAHIIFSTPQKNLKINCNSKMLHHILSHSTGPIDTVAKINYHSRNVGPVDTPDEIKYLSDSPGPIDAIMELLYHTRNEGQVDTVFEWYRLARNSGDISSTDEIKYHNQNPGPQDTMGERLRRTKNTGPVDTDDERQYYKPNPQASQLSEKQDDLPAFNPRPNPYKNT